MAKKKRGRGRPKGKRTAERPETAEVSSYRRTEKQRKEIEEHAEARGLKVATYVLRRAIRKI